MKERFELCCSKCEDIYAKEYEPETVSRSSFIPICPKCVKVKISEGVSKIHALRIEKTPYDQLTSIRRKRRLWRIQGEECVECGYNRFTIEHGPYELHHIDGNVNNTDINNEQVLCCNCHAMTDNYRFKGGNGGQKKSDRLGGIYKQRESWVQS